MNVFIDTNVLLVSLPGRSSFHPIYQAIQQHKFDTYVTNEILTEYEEQISIRLGIERTEIQIRELLNLPGVHQIDVYYRWQLVTADSDDDKFTDCAIACAADYLVTNDRHYDILKTLAFPAVQIIRAEEFLVLLDSLD